MKYAAPLYNPFNKVPLIGPWYGRIGRVFRILSYPCAADPVIWVEAAWVGLPRLLWTLVKPDFLDYKWDMFTKGKTPIGPEFAGGKSRHSGRGRFRAGGVIHPEHGGGKGRYWVPFYIGELAQKVGWYISVVDVATEFVYNWASMVYVFAGCESLDTAWGHFTADLDNVIASPFVQRCQVFTPADGHFVHCQPDAVHFDNNGAKSFGISLSFSAPSIEPNRFQAPNTWVTSGAGGPKIADLPNRPGENGSVVASTNFTIWDETAGQNDFTLWMQSPQLGGFHATGTWDCYGSFTQLGIELLPFHPLKHNFIA